MSINSITVAFAKEEHVKYAERICSLIYESALQRGTGIAKRSPEYISAKIKGGKAVATSVGTFAVCCPLAIILGLTAFVIYLIVSKIVSLSSLIATVVVVGVAIVYAIVANLSYYNIIPVIIMALIAGVIVFIKHTANIKRLIEGTEPTISAKKR